MVTLWKNRELIYQLTKRELQLRYRGSALGFVWSLVTPILMLGVYTFVFGVIFSARWNVKVENNLEFALILFCGLSIFGIFAESLSRAPGIVVGNVNYIKKVVFPLEILPVTIVGSALFNGLINILVLVVFSYCYSGNFPVTIFYLPLVLLPLLLLSLGLSWFLASLGVFLRDINQIIPVAVSALMLLSPIFYPVNAIPEKFHTFYFLNPISYIVEDARRTIIWGFEPDWHWILFGSLLGLLISMLGYYWFQRTRKGFADVV